MTRKRPPRQCEWTGTTRQLRIFVKKEMGELWDPKLELHGPADYLPGLWAAWDCAWDWLPDAEDYPPRGGDHRRLLRAILFSVRQGEGRSVNMGATNAGIPAGSARAWMHRYPELKAEAQTILAMDTMVEDETGYPVASWHPEFVGQLNKMQELPSIERDIDQLRAGRGPSRDFLEILNAVSFRDRPGYVRNIEEAS